MYALVVRHKFGNHYIGLYHSLREVISAIKKAMLYEEIMDEAPPTVKEIRDRIKSSYTEEFYHEFENGTYVVVQELTNHKPIIPEVKITIKDGMIRSVTGNGPARVIIKNKDLNDIEEYTIKPQKHSKKEDKHKNQKH